MSFFHEGVDDYLAYCAETGREPTRPFSGRLNVRMDAELHRRVHAASQRRGMSLNRFITGALSEVVE